MLIKTLLFSVKHKSTSIFVLGLFLFRFDPPFSIVLHISLFPDHIFSEVLQQQQTAIPESRSNLSSPQSELNELLGAAYFKQSVNGYCDDDA